MRSASGLVAGMVLAARLLAAEPLDPKNVPANQWVEQTTNGWKGKTNYGSVLQYGFCAAGEHGTVSWDAYDEVGTIRIRRFDPATGAWANLTAGTLEPAYAEFGGGRRFDGNLHGIQLCYDADRQVLVGLTTTDLNGQSRTVEFDLRTKQAAGVKPNPSPPTITAASLCYDPINKEVILATGGFSPVGGTNGTWLYDGTKKAWRTLPGPKELEDVRAGLQKAHERLVTLRWLTWKNLEFRATGRDKLLDDRARAETLAKECARLVVDLKNVAEAAKTNAAKVERPYHRERLAAASALVTGALEHISGAEAKFKSGSPEELEKLYRADLVPAQEGAEQAVAELATSPEPRMSARLVYDPKSKVVLCFGGDGQRCAWGDTWVYHCEGRWWERRQPKSHPAPGQSRALTYDPQSGLIVLCRQRPATGPAGQELWTYDVAKNDWRQWAIAAPAEAFWLEHGGAGGMIAFNLGLNKAWLLRLDLATAKPVTAKDAPEGAWVPIDGQFVLRDAAGVEELRKWKTETDAWVQAVPDNTWVPMPTHGSGRPNWGRSWSSHVYDSDRRQLYYRDGGHGSYHGADTDHYDLPTGRWFRSDRRDLPPWPMGSYFGWGRSFSNAPWAIHSYKYGLFYNPLRQRLQRQIGQSGNFDGMATAASVLEYDPDTGLWSRELHTLPGPVGGMIGGPIIPGLPDALACVHNFSRYGTSNGEGWLQTAKGVKQWKNLGMLPRSWDDHSWSWFFDSQRKRIMYYGGSKENQQLFALDITAAEPRWTEIKIKGAEGKLPLSSREVVYVPRHDVFLMTSTLDAQKQAPLEDLIWSFEPRNGVFRRLKLAKGTGVAIQQGGGVSDGLQYDPVADLCSFTQQSNSAPQVIAFRYVP